MGIAYRQTIAMQRMVTLLVEIKDTLGLKPPDCLGITHSVDDLGGDIGTNCYMRDVLIQKIEKELNR